MTTLKIRRLVCQMAKARLGCANRAGDKKEQAQALGDLNRARANFKRQVRLVEAYLGREHRV